MNENRLKIGQYKPKYAIFDADNMEGIYALFISAFVAVFILASFFIGFNIYIYLLGMIPAAILAFFYPRAAILAVILLTFIFERFFTLQPLAIGRELYKFYPLDAIFGAMLLGAAMQFFTQKIKLKLCAVDYCLLGFMFLAFIYFLISVLFLGGDFALAFSSFKNYALYPLIYFAILILFKNREQLRKIFTFGFFGALAIIVFLLIGIVRGEGLWSEFTPLSTAGVRILAFPHAFYLSLAFLGMSAYLLFVRKINVNYFLLTLIWLVGIVGSMMRHLWVSLVLAIATLYVMVPPAARIKWRQIILRYIFIGLFVVSLSVALAGIFPWSDFSQKSGSIAESLGNRFFSITSAEDESILWRKELWKKSFGEYGEKLIAGIGYGQKLSIEIGQYRDIVEVRNVHNSLLAILMQMGILGLAVFLWIPFLAIRKSWNRKNFTYLEYALIAMLIFQLAAFMFQPYLEANLLGLFFWITLGMLRSSVNYNKKS